MQEQLGPEQKAQVDALRSANSNEAGLIDLKSYENDVFTIFGYKLNALFADVLLATYVDLSEDGDAINRNGVLIPINQVQKAWRIGEVLLAGPSCQTATVGSYICFPNDKGIPVSNIDVEGYGIVKNGIFLNEQRIFGLCSPADINNKNENRSTDSGKSSSGKRSRSQIRKKKS
jgi:hypothetical protein|tara:strand:+ start:588 stop:1109 length:522 start_codon:yes stop_codon:yes gene_type:complete